jgi:predicted Zn-dependent peptidase
MNKLILLPAFLCLASVVGAQSDKAPSVRIDFIEYDLPNGLHVIMYPDNSTPNVVVSLMYHVGAKNEDPNNTGFAHFFEHLMFEGSENIERGEYFKLVQSNGGELNANTTQDRTYYYELMPSNQLELALWMESERMLHAKIDTIGVNTQKNVVIEEYKQTYDRPYASFMYELGKRAFSEHPYRWQTIGDPEHIRAATMEDITDFYKTYYVPNNAVLVLAGDFATESAKKLVKKYFGSIPKGTREMTRPNIVEPPLASEKRDVIYDKIQIPAVMMGYRAPAMGTKDAYAFDILQNILSGGASSRFRTEIDDKGKALQSIAFYFECEHPGLMYILSICPMNGKPEDVEKLLNEQMDKACNELVSEKEFKKAIVAKQRDLVTGKAQLANIAYALANNYTYFKNASMINSELENYNSLTREDLLAVAKKYLTPNNRVVLYYLPNK